MDKDGTSSDAGVAQASMAMANKHERNLLSLSKFLKYLRFNVIFY